MTRDEILNLIKTRQSELKQYNVRALYLFGSAARNEARRDSDVDFIVEFDGPATFDLYVGLQSFLENLLGASVDLVTRKGLRKELVPLIEKDSIRAA